jgi:hypothetical protein
MSNCALADGNRLTVGLLCLSSTIYAVANLSASTLSQDSRVPFRSERARVVVSIGRSFAFCYFSVTYLDNPTKRHPALNCSSVACNVNGFLSFQALFHRFFQYKQLNILYQLFDTLRQLFDTVL